jgi:hypothetical protein
MELALTLKYLEANKDPRARSLLHGNRQGVTSPWPMPSAGCSPRASWHGRAELATKGPENPVVAEGLEGLLSFYRDLCWPNRTLGRLGQPSHRVVFGYTRPPATA